MNANEWLAAFAERLGTEPPTTDEFKKILDVAGEAAHSSERVAAPAATLGGGARPASTSTRRCGSRARSGR